MNFKYNAIIILLCISFVPAKAAFLNKVKEYGYPLAKGLIVRTAARYALTGAALVYNRFLISRGLDANSINDDARAVGSAAQKRFPALLTHRVPIAPETVPALMRDRIARLNRQDYSWPACKPILLAGLAGSGKTQLGYYLAQNSNSPFLYESAAGLIGSKPNSGVEGICALFKRARRRPIVEAAGLAIKNMFKWMCRRQQIIRKPAVILLDEIDALAQPVNEHEVIEGDQNLERERHNAFERLLWEMGRNPHQVGKPAQRRNPAMVYLPENNILRQLLSQHPELADRIPHYACPPADFFEKYLVTVVRSEFMAGLNAASRVAQITGEPQRITPQQIQEMFAEETILPFWHAITSNPTVNRNQLRGPVGNQSITTRFLLWFLNMEARFVYWCNAKDDTDSLVIATTNKRADELDPRIYQIFEVINMQPLNAQDRLHVLEFHGHGKHFAADVQLQAIADATEGFTGDELASILNDAAMTAAAADRAVITQQDIAQAQARINELRRVRQHA